MKRLLLASLVVAASGCSMFSDDGPKYGRTLASLEAASVPDDLNPVPRVELGEIEKSYRSALEVALDPEIRHKILIRLADIEMARSENRQLTAEEQGEFFGGAITMYQELLELNKARQGVDDTPTNERILYQLSKAYALDGKLEESNQVLGALVSDHPESDYAAEAEFRRAELAFSEGDYALSEKLYAQVMARGKETPFYLNAVYMHGWSQFKRNSYRASIRSFTEVLDTVLVEGQPSEEMSNSQKNMAADTLRIVAIVFSYIDGAETITEVYNNLGLRHYQYMLYMQLGDLYLEKRRYRDSADTYRHYVKHFPTTNQAPDFSVKAIEVYNLGNFPSEILPAKEEYVQNYGINSEFWVQRSEEQRAPLKPYLRQYIEELSSYYHSRAQALVTADAEYKRLKARGEKPERGELVKPDDALPVYLKAADFYNQFVRTFPQDEKTPEMAFLMGEAYFEAGYYPEAADAYEAVAYDYLDKKRGGEAGYAAIITLSKLVEQTQEQTQAAWAKRKITSSVNFADYYPTHPQAVAVLTQASEDVFKSGDLDRAVILSSRVVAWQPEPNKNLRKTALLVLAHSQFDLNVYDAAETAYRQVLALQEANDPERTAIIERIAASIFRSSELQIAGGDKAGAIDRLLSIQAVAPDSDIAISAQYDASVYLMELKRWDEAENVLTTFKTRYPTNSLSRDIPAKLAFIYQESEQWDKAAAVLAKMASDESDPELRRQSRYLSAELYEKSGRPAKAIEQYRDYAHNYPQPFGLATEARYKLVTLYEQAGDSNKRRFWLKELIAENKKAGDSKTARSNYLAAMAASEFAQDDYLAFNRIKLNQPIKSSLKKKKAALDTALKSYKGVIDYGVAEFATLANYRIGEIYRQLSRDLMDSERPQGLDELALEQYEILIEEQAYPFEEKSIDIHAANVKRTRAGIYDDWVKESFAALAKLLPARYGKKEEALEVSDALF